jgi:hypothetical protein
VNHPHTQYWFATIFGIDAIPCWWYRRKELVEDLAFLYNLQQETYYRKLDRQQFRQQLFYVSRKFKLKYQYIYHMLGVMSTDPADAWGCLRDYLNRGDPKLRRTRKN